MSSSLNTLSAASEDRKSRLAALRNLKRKQPDDESAVPEPERSPSQPEEQDISRHLSGRNYDPETKGPKLGFDDAPNLGLEKPTLEEQAADVESEVKRQAAEEEAADKGIDLFKLQPKKPNWDLKRSLESKLDVLNVRTDNAIARLVRERIAGAQKAAAAKSADKTDGEAVGMDGVALVEGLRVREQEEEEDERRERQEEEALVA